MNPEVKKVPSQETELSRTRQMIIAKGRELSLRPKKFNDRPSFIVLRDIMESPVTGETYLPRMQCIWIVAELCNSNTTAIQKLQNDLETEEYFKEKLTPEKKKFHGIPEGRSYTIDQTAILLMGVSYLKSNEISQTENKDMRTLVHYINSCLEANH